MTNGTMPSSQAGRIRTQQNETPLAMRSRSKDRTLGHFRYESLEEGQIRLLIITGFHLSTNLGKKIPVCELKPVSIRYERFTPDYTALSYVWGADERSETIICNSKRLTVTASVFDALSHLYSRRLHETLPIWIDDVCINQKNNIEKTLQVKKMHLIYQRAYKVVAFLGRAAKDSDYALGQIHNLTRRLAFSPDVLHPKSLASNGLPHQYHRLWTAVALVLDRPWFRRVWTFQEAVLSQRLSIFCGYVVIRWSLLRDFCDQMNWHMLYYLLLSPHSKNGPNTYFPNKQNATSGDSGRFPTREMSRNKSIISTACLVSLPRIFVAKYRWNTALRATVT